MVAEIKERPNARICLYGVAGTDKSAYAKFVASKIEVAQIARGR